MSTDRRVDLRRKNRYRNEAWFSEHAEEPDQDPTFSVNGTKFTIMRREDGQPFYATL